ncbi:permease-like cell division protein FtsX [Ruminococcaceae bacterium OttesenSCG-928-D13]|nr:permease-like cell division protein FtsX [Ruminococcaceae bacterium OttesenSCG-928-D13]
MRLSSFGYLCKQGWKNMGANRLMTFASIGVLTACFIITGIAALLVLDINAVVDHLADQNEIAVYLYPEVEDDRAEQIGNEIRALPNVGEVEYVSKLDAFGKMERMMEGYGNLLDGFEQIFPASYNVTVEDLGLIGETNQRLEAIDGVERTYVPVDLAEIMITIKNAVTYGGWGIVILLGLVSLIVISNTIRLTVFARRREISIMKYVGATNTFIRLPFFVEGMTVGIIAGLLSSGVVCGAYYLAMNFLHEMYNVWVLGLLDSLLRLEDIWYFVVVGAVVLGVIVGGIGTASSVKKHLKV